MNRHGKLVAKPRASLELCSRPNYWIVNPIYIKYNEVPKQITCTECYQGKKSNKHNIQTILYDNNEKRYEFNKIKKIKCDYTDYYIFRS